jgi:hypothetical protein
VRLPTASYARRRVKLARVPRGILASGFLTYERRDRRHGKSRPGARAQLRGSSAAILPRFPREGCFPLDDTIREGRDAFLFS